MANTKDYAMRELIYDQCFSTGKEYTCKQLMEIVNNQLEDRSMKPIQSRTTFMQDIMEMNEKFFHLYNKYGIVWEDRNKKRYYRYRRGIDSIYNRELTQEELEKLLEVRNLLRGLNGMPQFDWVEPMMTRLDQNIMGKQREIASFEGGTKKDAKFLMPLFKAIAERKVLDVGYQKFGAETRVHVLHPYYLKQYRRRWYLFATILDHAFITCFSLDRILSIARNKDVPYQESGVDFNHYFDDIVGVSHPDNGEVEHIVLKGDRWVEDYLRTLPIHPLQQLESLRDEGCRVTMDVMINNELIQELAFYGDHLRVESPKRLRDKMVERAQNQIDDYRKMDDFGDNLEED